MLGVTFATSIDSRKTLSALSSMLRNQQTLAARLSDASYVPARDINGLYRPHGKVL